MRNLPIRSLSLSHNKIGYIEKNAITDMPNLASVDLSHNELVRVDVQSFINTPYMTWINLDRNCLTKIGERNFDFMNDTIEMVSARDNRINEIHSQAFEFKTVNCIIFNSNKLKNVPEEIWIDSKATVVELEDNELEMLPESFFGHTDLDYVNLRNNPLRCEMVEKLNETVKNMNILIWYDAEQVFAEYNQTVVKSDEDGVLITVLQKLPSLRKGMLEMTALVDILLLENLGLLEIEPGAFDNQNIQKLILADNNLTTIRTGTFKNLPLQYLTLFGNQIESIEANGISDMPELRSIDLSFNKIVQIDAGKFRYDMTDNLQRLL
ncbi:leucine-rich repeat-containing G-protein coupled receptor 5-like [Tenebrio molitor]|uniref:leucine-rich repeat-containing G-protein coupled receptor 5-like n=1 Tax=Tenebrio molitor TaxID=7067 RepID=UPI00362474B0